MSVFLMPQRIKTTLILRYYLHPFVLLYRTRKTQIMMQLFERGIHRGLSLDDVLYGLMTSRDPLQNQRVRQVIDDLSLGIGLSEAMQRIDPTLGPVFKLNDVDHPIEMNLKRYLQLLEIKLKFLIQAVRWTLMSMAYLSFGLIIITAYQMMFEPIRLMEELL